MDSDVIIVILGRPLARVQVAYLLTVMSTKKPLIRAYVSQKLFDQFKDYCSREGAISISQGLEFLLEEFFESEQSEPSEPSVNQEDLIKAVSFVVAAEYSPVLSQLKQKILVQGTLIDTLSYSLRILESKLLGGLPGELPVSDGGLPGELPVNNGGLPGELPVNNGGLPDYKQAFE